MDESAIERGWLTISDSPKKQFKRESRKTSKGRTPLGDKGLGRLGTQRLGNHLAIETRTGNGRQVNLRIDWDSFAQGALLEEVPVDYETIRSKGERGTKLTITGLRDLQKWIDNGRTELVTDLARVVSPYIPIKKFKVFAFFNGDRLNLLEFGDKLRTAALTNYRFKYLDGLLTVNGRARLDYFQPPKKDRALFETLVRSDNGESFFAFLKADKGESRFDFRRSSDSWWVDYQLKQPLEDIDGVELTSGIVADPGSFDGELDYFSLAPDAAKVVFPNRKQYRELIDALGGIRVYRDGFGIRLGPDWLGLGEQWTSAGSYYTLKPQNTLGYIALSALSNSCLEEKTDREGFSDNPNYRNFVRLLREFVEYAGNAQEFLRRGWNAYKSYKAFQDAEIATTSEPEDLSASVRSTLDKAANYRRALTTISEALSSVSADSASLLQEKTSGSLADPRVLASTSARLSASISEARAVIPEIDAYLKELEQKEKVVGLMADQVEALRDQMRQMHDVIALGLTAEALSHELSAITSDMAQKNDQIIKYLRSSGPRDQRVLAYAEHIRSVTTSLRKELSFLAPSLQYVREKREDIVLKDFFNEQIKYHVAGFSTNRISLRTSTSDTGPFIVRMSRGKLLQIFENLFLNAEYWLREDIRMNRISFGTINVRMQKPRVVVSDNGRGIDPKLEQSLFEPFVSGKGRGKGRGLGLFIVQQLLAAENCSIRLLPERNDYQRLWQFEIDLRGVTIG